MCLIGVERNVCIDFCVALNSLRYVRTKGMRMTSDCSTEKKLDVLQYRCKPWGKEYVKMGSNAAMPYMMRLIQGDDSPPLSEPY